MAAGGRATIPDGVLATVRFTVAPLRQTVKLTLAVENIEVLHENMKRARPRKTEAVLLVAL
jgi:hypothetical protein